MELGPEDRILPARTGEKDRDWILVATLAIGLFAVIAYALMPELRERVVAAVSKSPGGEFAELYGKWGLEPLPAGIAASAKIHVSLAKLARNPCDRTEVFRLGEDLAEQGEVRLAANLYLAFAGACPNSSGEQYRAASLYQYLGDYEKVIRLADDLLVGQPASGSFHFLRGQAAAALKRWEEALVDYKTTIQLEKKPETLTEAVFTGLANIYSALGRPCDAGATILAWIALDPRSRNTPAAHKTASEYLARGCRPNTPPADLRRL